MRNTVPGVVVCTQAGRLAEWCSSALVLALARVTTRPAQLRPYLPDNSNYPACLKIAPSWPAPPPPPEPLTPDVGIDPTVEARPTRVVPDVLLTPDVGVEPDVVPYPIRIARFFCICLRPD